MTSPVTARVLADDGLADLGAQPDQRLAGGLGGLAVGGDGGRRGIEGLAASRSAYLRFQDVQLVGQSHERPVVLRFGTVQQLRRRRGDAGRYGQQTASTIAGVPSSRRRPEPSAPAGYSGARRAAPSAARPRDRAAR